MLRISNNYNKLRIKTRNKIQHNLDKIQRYHIRSSSLGLHPNLCPVHQHDFTFTPRQSQFKTSRLDLENIN